MKAELIQKDTVELTVPPNIFDPVERVVMKLDGKHDCKVMYTDGKDPARWKVKIQKSAYSRRLAWECSVCGYISRSRTRYCAGCGNPMGRGVKNADTEK